MKKIVHLINRIKIEIDYFYNYDIKRPTNYEDIYFVIHELIQNDELFYTSNPIAKRFLEHILPDIKPILSRLNEREEEAKIRKETPQPFQEKSNTNIYGPEDYTLNDFFNLSLNYIHDVVWSMLASKPEHIDYLNFIHDALNDKDFNLKNKGYSSDSSKRKYISDKRNFESI